MSKSKSKNKSKHKSMFFWICVVLAILAVASLIVYLIICNCNSESYECKFRHLKSRSKYHHLNDLVCCENEENLKKYEKIQAFLKKIAEYSCSQQSENNKLCIENFMKCGQRCVNVTDEDLIELDKLEKGGDMKKVMEYVKKNILDELNQGDCRMKKDVDSLVEENGKKVLKEKSATCYEMISNYF